MRTEDVADTDATVSSKCDKIVHLEFGQPIIGLNGATASVRAHSGDTLQEMKKKHLEF